jgi:TfoX/Sxy family transcriptional regulator of competence genes
MASTLRMLETRLLPMGAVAKKMFGGVCFMLNGNMVAGTSKRGMLVRAGPPNDAIAAARGTAEPMVMGDRPMKGYWFVPDAAVSSPSEFDFWIDMALAFNRTLPAK